MTISNLRSRGLGLLGVVLAPLALGALLLAVAAAAVMLIAAVDPAAGDSTVAAVVAASVLPAGAVAVWVGSRLGRPGRVEPAWLVPALLGLGMLGVGSLPIVGEALGEHRSVVVGSIALWSALGTGLALLVRLLAGRVPAWLLVLVTAAVAVGGLDLVFTWYAHQIVEPGVRDVPAPWWYPTAVTGADFGRAGAATAVFEVLKGLPALFTVCTGFVVSLGWAARQRHE